MGEIADMMINGELDYVTGEYMGRPTGYPRTNELGGKGSNSKWGVTNWMNINGIEDKQKQMDILRAYVRGLS